MTSPEQALDVIHGRFGAHDGRRALHAKGVLCRGRFTATPEAARLTRAAHMSGEATTATVRLSNGGGDPEVPDHAPDVRGLAVSFHLPDGSRTDMLAQTQPQFPFPNVERFLEVVRTSRPSLGSAARLPATIARNPRLIRALPGNVRSMNSPPASFLARAYYPIHAYRWVDSQGAGRWVRYTWKPTVDEPDIPRREAKERGRDYLFDELRERLAKGPATMELEVTIAGEGDNPHDPSSVWPEDREQVIVGTLEVAAIDEGGDDSIVFDPMRLTDGIEPSDDPVLRFRPSVYSRSHERRVP